MLLAAAAAAAAPAPQAYRETIDGTLVSFEMVPVSGSEDGVVKPFHVGRTEVTWDMFDVFALGLDEKTPAATADAIARPSRPYGSPDQGWGHAGFPAISVTRDAAEAFAAWLARKTGKPYRLPTEAEWAHAAALAAGRDFMASREAVAWHRGNSSRRAHAVAGRKADALGLFDLFGNAAEWVITADGSRALRGGSFDDEPERVGPGARAVQQEWWNERDPQLPKSKWWLPDAPFAGFRLARSGG